MALDFFLQSWSLMVYEIFSLVFSLYTGILQLKFFPVFYYFMLLGFENIHSCALIYLYIVNYRLLFSLKVLPCFDKTFYIRTVKYRLATSATFALNYNSTQ